MTSPPSGRVAVVRVILALVALAALIGLGIPRPVAAEPGISGPELMMQLPWDASSGEGGRVVLGRLDGNEGASEGPMSFAVASNGDVLVLDQVRMRVLRLGKNGALVADFDIPADTFQDIAVVADGRILLLDRLARRSILVVRDGGEQIAEYPVVGAGIPEGGGITAMLARPDGIWLEFGHVRSVRVLDPKLQPGDRAIVVGRAGAQAGTAFRVALDGKGGARLLEEEVASGVVLQQRDVTFDLPVQRLATVDGDGQGNLCAVGHGIEWDPGEGMTPLHEEDVGSCWDASGRERGRPRSSFVITEHEQFREFAFAPDGSLWQMGFADDGVSFLRWSWR